MELSAYLYLPAAQGKHTSSSTQGKQKKNTRYCFVDEETLSESWWQRLTLRRIQHPVLWWRYNINQVASSWLLVNISSAQGRFSKTLLQNGVFVENKKSIVTMSFDLPHGWDCLLPSTLPCTSRHKFTADNKLVPASPFNLYRISSERNGAFAFIILLPLFGMRWLIIHTHCNDFAVSLLYLANLSPTVKLPWQTRRTPS